MSAENAHPRVLVVGGASGIGLAVAQAFAAKHYDVTIADRDAAGLRDAAQTLAGEAATIQVDVTDEAAVAAMAAALGERGGVDALVNTVGLNKLGRISDLCLADWRTTIDVCLTGAFLVVKHGAAVVKDGGAIVTISSLNGQQPAIGLGAYCAAKAGVEMLTQVAAMELGPRSIRVNAVAPGLIETPLVRPLFDLPGIHAEFLDNTPMGRSGTPDDVARVVTLLCEEGLWVSGTTVTVDGAAHTRRYPDLLDAIAAARATADSPSGKEF